MKQSDFLRLALLLSDGEAVTFKRNLAKLVKFVLFENYGNSLTISEIIQQINERYSLCFADNEIKSAILSAKESIVEIRPTKDPVYFTYSISPKEYEKQLNCFTDDALTPYIEKFLSGNQSEGFISCDDLKQVIYRFLYQGFNSNIQTVLSLMNYHGEIKEWDLGEGGFTDKEIVSLNAFLNWQNAEKNALLFKYVSFCYEYCVMTVKKDKTAFASIFQGKEFYLDANVIFRLAGFNKAERKDAVTAFLSKCKECGVCINYTNFTRTEIDNTLEHHVLAIKNLLGGAAPISMDAMQILSSKYANLDFYEHYVNWTKNPKNKIGDYNAFLADLKRQVSLRTTGIKFKVAETFDQAKTKEKFGELTKDLTAFKASRNKGTYEGSIKVDVENYLYIQKLTEGNRSINFFDEKYFFITADHAYIDWSHEKTPGAIPLFVLPSVWYAIMLKYHGRTDDDYTSFCHFLNQRISLTPDELQKQKTQMLACVLEMNESVKIKEEIIFDIGQRLSNTTDAIPDVEAFVEESHTKITEGKVTEAVQQLRKEHRHETNQMFQETDKKIQLEKEKGYQEGTTHGRNEILYGQAKHIAARNKVIHVVLIILAIISVTATASVLVYQAYTGTGVSVPILSIIEEKPIISMIISGAFALLSLLFAKIGEYISFFSLDVEKIKARLEHKAEKYLK